MNTGVPRPSAATPLFFFIIISGSKERIKHRRKLGELKCVKIIGLSTTTKKLSLESNIAVATLIKNGESGTLILVSCTVNANPKVNINE